MRTHSFLRHLIWAPIVVTSIASAQVEDATNSTLPRLDFASPPPRNRFGLNYRAGFNIKASFKSLGGATPSDPGPATRGVDHNYDNGYNRVDSSGNAGGMTWNWGYANDSQIVGDTIVFNSSRSGDISKDVDSDPNHGVEVTYNRQLGVWGRSRWGLEAALNYTAINIRDLNTRSDGPSIVDTYALGGITPPLAPYAGTFAGPGALISDLPNRLPVSVRSKLDADLYGLRLGPYLEFPIHHRLAGSFSGGLALLSVNSSFSFQESAPGLGILGSGSGSHSKILAGGYAGANLIYAVNRSIDITAGVQYQNVGSYSHREANKQADLDLGKSIFVTVGMGFSF